MEQRDQELLDKQLGWLDSSRPHNAVMALAVAAIFFAGMTFGAALFDNANAPMRLASNDAALAASAHGIAPHDATMTR